MAEIELRNVQHSYQGHLGPGAELALREVELTWEDGGAYALLGPSGCGKTTLLNIISGLLTPTAGSVVFDGEEVTALSADRRNIAQVFQFPVVYDTMSVYQNLAFPLRNRGIDRDTIDTRIREVAAMLELEPVLERRAANLTADNKQKIALARGLVRSDVNAILFDEPLTVIDPHLKWQLRSKLKELHRRVSFTMIYVTHDQTEALTFADQVVVMHEGDIVQVGTSEELFEHPQHTFVGHFIGSPGMNVLPCTVEGGKVRFGDHRIATAAPVSTPAGSERVELGVRPEFIRFDVSGFPVEIRHIADVGRYRIVDAAAANGEFKVYVPEGAVIPDTDPRVVFDPAHTHVYVDGWRHEG